MTEIDGGILLEREGAILKIGINRPAKMNGWTPGMIRNYAQALQTLGDDSTLFCAVVYGVGSHTTAGLDLAKAAEVWERGESLYPADLPDMYDLRAPARTKPLVMAAQGICFTIGVELMLGADIVVAASDCRFAVFEVKRGIMPSGGATIRFVQQAGWSNAMRYLLTADEFDAETAHRFGIVQDIVAPGEQLDRAMDYARRICANAAPLAVQATRANARLALEQGAEAARAQFDATRARLRQTQDAAEGVLSFKEKRPPRFTGR